MWFILFRLRLLRVVSNQDFLNLTKLCIYLTYIHNITNKLILQYKIPIIVIVLRQTKSKILGLVSLKYEIFDIVDTNTHENKKYRSYHTMCCIMLQHVQYDLSQEKVLIHKRLEICYRIGSCDSRHRLKVLQRRPWSLLEETISFEKQFTDGVTKNNTQEIFLIVDRWYITYRILISYSEIITIELWNTQHLFSVTITKNNVFLIYK